MPLLSFFSATDLIFKLGSPNPVTLPNFSLRDGCCTFKKDVPHGRLQDHFGSGEDLVFFFLHPPKFSENILISLLYRRRIKVESNDACLVKIGL